MAGPRARRSVSVSNGGTRRSRRSMGTWWTEAVGGRQGFLCFSLVAVYLFVPLAWAPGVSFDSIKVLVFLALVVPAVATWVIRVSDGWPSVMTSELTAPLGLLFGASGLSLLAGPSWRLALPALFWLLTLGLFLLFLTDMLRAPGSLELLSRAVCISAVLAATFGMFQFYDLFNVEEFYPSRPMLFSTFGNPNTAANFVAATLPVMGCLALVGHGIRAWAWSAAIAVCYAFLLLAQSRSNWLALGLGVAFALVAGWRKPAFDLSRKKLRSVLWLTMVLAIITWIYTMQNPLNRRVAPFDRVQGSFVPGTEAYVSRSFRQTMREAVQRMVRDHPLLGVGIGNFPAVSAEYLGKVQADSGAQQGLGFWWQAHNEYLQVLAEVGPLGLLGFLGLVLPPVFRAPRTLSTRPPSLGLSILGFVSGLVVFLVDSWFNFPLRKPPNVLLFLFLLAATHASSLHVREGGERLASKGDEGRRRRWIHPSAISAVSRLQQPVAVLCAAILAAGAAFAGGHLAGEILMARGEASLASGDTQAAAAAFRRALHLAPFKWDVPKRLGALYASSGQARQAVEALADADRFFKEGMIARALGVAYGLLGDFEAARAQYRRALFYDPGDSRARLGLAISYRDIGDYRAAAAEARLGLKGAPRDGHLRYVLGTSLAKLGQSEEALRQLVMAMRLRESDREIAAEVEEVARAVGRTDAAERARRRLSAIAVADRAANLRQRSMPAVEGWLTIALQRDPEYADPHFELGRLYFNSHRPELALQAFRAYLRKAPMGEKAEEAVRYARVLEHPSLLARVLGRDPRLDVGI